VLIVSGTGLAIHGVVDLTRAEWLHATRDSALVVIGVPVLVVILRDDVRERSSKLSHPHPDSN
jgi:hypothetical protein